jgi:5-amino-6-(5-phosphoribosylamino)uracil reductase
VAERPYVLLSCGMSIDGYLNAATEQRLLLSNDADFDRVDAVRAQSDAILVGAATVRRDNPRLLVRSAARQAERVARGWTPSPVKVTMTAGGEDLDPGCQFFTAGDTDKLVYCSSPAMENVEKLLGQIYPGWSRTCISGAYTD